MDEDPTVRGDDSLSMFLASLVLFNMNLCLRIPVSECRIQELSRGVRQQLIRFSTILRTKSPAVSTQ